MLLAANPAGMGSEAAQIPVVLIWHGRPVGVSTECRWHCWLGREHSSATRTCRMWPFVHFMGREFLNTPPDGV